MYGSTKTADTEVDPPHRGPSFVPSLVSLLVLLLMMFGAFLFGRARGSRGFVATMENAASRSRLVADMEVKLLASAEAEKSAVMAETDEESQSFATESRRAATAVENDRVELGRVVENDRRPDELQLFREFSGCWSRLQEIDHGILDLAVANTNLKAQRLALIPAAVALDRMQTALDGLLADGTAAAPIAISAYRLMTSARKIHALESRHIAAARDDEMDAIETEMKGLEQKISDAFASLSAATGETGTSAIDAARAADADFEKIRAEVLALSRQNSNVRSLSASLGQKRKVMAECQDRLHALQETAGSDVLKATR